MKCVEERLAEYRRKQDATYCKIQNHEAIYGDQFKSSEVGLHSIIISKFMNMLSKPIHLWLCFYNNCPRLCIIFVVLLWLLIQWYFTYIEFGLVFFVSSLFVLLFINMGRRKAGELSAYSVFNPQCERLPGTLTAAHFERDLLKREVPHK